MKIKALSILLLIFFVACATTMETKLTYLTARDSFNVALSNYSERVRAMTAGAEKDFIKNTFNPFWKDAEIALDGWGEAAKGSSAVDPAVAVRRYSAAKNRLIELGMKHFGDKIFRE